MQRRHKIDIAKLGSSDFLESRVQRSLGKIAENPDLNISVLLGHQLNLSRLAILVNKDFELFTERIRRYVNLSIVEIRRNNSNVNFNINGDSYYLNSANKSITDSNFRVFNLMNFAIIINDQDLIHRLSVLELSSDESPYWIKSLEFLKSCLVNQVDISRIIYEELIDLSNNGTTMFIGLDGNKIINSNSIAENYKTLRTPIINLYKSITDENSILFNQILEEYSIGKRRWIGKYKKLDDWNFWIDFNAWSCCLLAKRNRIKVKFQTEYIPFDLCN